MLATSPQWISIRMGASNAESTSSSATLNGSSRPPPARRRLPLPAKASTPSDLGGAEDREAQDEGVKRAHGVEVRPHRKQAERPGEILGPRKLVLHAEPERREEEQQPYRRRDKGEDPGQRGGSGSPSASLSRGARGRVAGFPDTSDGRGWRGRPGWPGRPRTSRADRRRSARSSRRDGAGRPRRNRGSGWDRRAEGGRAAPAARTTP